MSVVSSPNQTISPGTDLDRRAIGSAKTGGTVFATLILFIVAICAALTIDVVRTGYGIKGDEATYVAMGLSLAYDHDLSYQKRDLERFWGLYHSGPEGILLKRGKDVHVRFRKSWPYVRIT